jgi:hypothetical protein
MMIKVRRLPRIRTRSKPQTDDPSPHWQNSF